MFVYERKGATGDGGVQLLAITTMKSDLVEMRHYLSGYKRQYFEAHSFGYSKLNSDTL